ncbi:MAG: type 2 isopentenyl-diphosphate Delta-isomerase [Myxococcota bacterium]
MSQEISKRKRDHLELCATDEVAFRERTHLLDHVKLLHQSLPDLHLDEDIDLCIDLFGKKLRAPIVIAAMTGGTDEAGSVNEHLAKLANRRGYGFGLGSQRAMQKRPDTAWTFRVREQAPDLLLLGNLGCVQARDTSSEAIQRLLDDVGADAICVHMNPAMEMIQPGGDRNFRDVSKTFGRLCRELTVPVIGKETGSGISRACAAKLLEQGVRHVDVSGAGGTSWVGVETLRAEGDARALGELLWDWGIPTAAAIHYAVSAGLTAIATGGIRHGYDIARAIALGADAAGVARHVFKAYRAGGIAAADAFLRRCENELRTVMLLCGVSSIAQLKQAPHIVTGELREWIA